MNTQVNVPGASYGSGSLTRWQELNIIAAALVEAVCAVNPNGLDVYFLNRPGVYGVEHPNEVATIFSYNNENMSVIDSNGF